MKTQLAACFVGLMPMLILAQNEFPTAAIHPPAMTNSMSFATNQPARARLSPWASEVAKLAEADIDEDVILTFIDNSGTFNLDADQIIRLRELGVANQFVTAMIQHDADVISGMRPLTISSAPPAATIQFVLAAKDDSAKEKNSKNSTGLFDTEPETIGAPPDEDYENLAQQLDAADSFAQNSQSQNSRQPLYRVRQPYPEAVTAPILVFKAAGVTPNTLIIRFSQ